MAIFQCYVSSPEGNNIRVLQFSPWLKLRKKKNRAKVFPWRKKSSEIPQLLCHVTGFDPELGAQVFHRLFAAAAFKVQDFFHSLSGFKYDVDIWGFIEFIVYHGS